MFDVYTLRAMQLHVEWHTKSTTEEAEINIHNDKQVKNAKPVHNTCEKHKF
jgi:hypothetical protein